MLPEQYISIYYTLAVCCIAHSKFRTWNWMRLSVKYMHKNYSFSHHYHLLRTTTRSPAVAKIADRTVSKQSDYLVRLLPNSIYSFLRDIGPSVYGSWPFRVTWC